MHSDQFAIRLFSLIVDFAPGVLAFLFGKDSDADAFAHIRLRLAARGAKPVREENAMRSPVVRRPSEPVLEAAVANADATSHFLAARGELDKGLELAQTASGAIRRASQTFAVVQPVEPEKEG